MSFTNSIYKNEISEHILTRELRDIHIFKRSNNGTSYFFIDEEQMDHFGFDFFYKFIKED